MGVKNFQRRISTSIDIQVIGTGHMMLRKKIQLDYRERCCTLRKYVFGNSSNHDDDGCKGLAKLGNVAETMFLVMFPGWLNWDTTFRRKICVREAKMFLTPGENNFCFRSSKICFRNTFPARLNWETFASATMFPSLARP